MILRPSRTTFAAENGQHAVANPRGQHTSPAIQATGLSFTYAGCDAPVLQDVEFSVPKGAFCLMVGGTGSGKTTLLRLMKPEIAPVGEACGSLRVFGLELVGQGELGHGQNRRLGDKGGSPWTKSTIGGQKSGPKGPICGRFERLGDKMDEMNDWETESDLPIVKNVHEGSVLSPNRQKRPSNQCSDGCIAQDGCDSQSHPQLQPHPRLQSHPQLQSNGPAQVPGFVGFVFQDPGNQIVCDQVWHELAFGLENLGVPQPEMRRRVAEVAHFFGIEPLMDMQTSQLSGGQQQLVNLAAILAMRPGVLLLDEPTAQLDPVASKNFLHALFRINRELGITVVVSTHEPESMAEYATYCVELDQGAVRVADLEAYRSSGAADAVFSARDTLLTLVNDASSEVAADMAAAPAPATACPLAHAPEAGASAHEVPVIQLSDVCFRYQRDQKPVLRNCTLSVTPGTVHAIVGGNGSGKSTLLRVAAGILKPHPGRVRNACPGRQAFLPQDPRTLFVCDTVSEELMEWAPTCGYTKDQALRAARSHQLEALLNRHPYDLSGGQQQQLALAKVLLTAPSLLLADEPTKGLDAPSRLKVARTLRQLTSCGLTVVLVTHDLTFAALVADQVSLLFDGGITCTQPVREFFADNLFYRPQVDGLVRLLSKRPGKEDCHGCNQD